MTDQEDPSLAAPFSPEPSAHEQFEEGDEAAPPGVFIMSIVRWALVLAMATAAVASLFYVYGERGSTQGDGHATQYYCPMHPSVVQDHPGDCPICSMTLVAREAPKPPSSASGHASPAGLVPIDLPPERVALMGMRTASVRRAELPSTLRVVGVVAPTENAVSSVQTRYSGWIQEMHVASSGQAVTKGQLLARIYSPELLTAQQELLHAKRWSDAEKMNREGQASLFHNAKSRLTLMGMNAAEIEEVERTGEPHRLIEVRSPARGYISEKQAVEGILIQPGTELFRIADLSRVWVVIDVFERDASRITLGQEAIISLTAYPGEEFRGKVTFIYPVLSTETRTLRARVELRNPGLKLKPGMFAEVSMTARGADALLIPREALVDMGAHQFVFVQKEAGHFEPRVVRAGQRSDDAVEILSGVNEGETVVTTGNFLLDSVSRLRATIAGTGAAPAGAVSVGEE